MLLSNKSGWTTDTCSHLGREQRIYAEWKKIISEGYILCESIYTTIDTQNNSGGTQENYAKTTKANFFLHRALEQESRESSCWNPSSPSVHVHLLRHVQFGNPWDPPGSSVHGLSQARILEWVAVSSSGDLPNPRMKPTSSSSPALAGGFFTPEPLGKPRSPRGKTEAWVPNKLPVRLLCTAVLSQHAPSMPPELQKQLSSPTLNKSWQIRIASQATTK